MKETAMPCKQGSIIDCQKLIKGRYEAERLPNDFPTNGMVPDFAFNVLNPQGLLYRPVVDEDYLAKGGAKPVWPDGKPFAACLTHDVDHVTLYSFLQSNRMYALKHLNGATLKNQAGNLIGWCLDVAKVIKQAKLRDPLHCYERWLEAEEKVGARSTFFFWPGWKAITKHHHSDCLYDMQDRVIFDGQRCTVAEMIREIDRRGWEIGLHSSWYSFDNVEELKRQKAVLEKMLGHDVISVRQHFLHYDIRVTPRVQAEAGFKYDATLGFNDNVGFRFGTCYPWCLYDLSAEKELPITEIPLIIQEAALLHPTKGMRLDENTAFQYIKQITEAVESVGGILTLLWHPIGIMETAWWDLYIRTLKYLKEKNVCFGVVREIANLQVRVC